MADADGSLASRAAELRLVLAESGTRVLDFFRMWDADLSGEVDPEEFAPALRALGLQVSDEEANELFKSFDADGGGTLTHKEMYRQLRAGADVDMSSAVVKDELGNILSVNIAAGSAGEIVLESKNEIALRYGPPANIRSCWRYRRRCPSASMLAVRLNAYRELA